MTKVVIADRRYSNWQRGQNHPGSWRVIWQYEGKDITANLALTQRAIEHYQKYKDATGTATWRGSSIKDTLQIDDIKSVISATKRGEAVIYGNRMNEVIGYKLKNLPVHEDIVEKINSFLLK